MVILKKRGEREEQKENLKDKHTISDDKQGKSSKIPSSSPIKESLKSLGPGIITGASDDDPSGIATFSQAGAQF